MEIVIRAGPQSAIVAARLCDVQSNTIAFCDVSKRSRISGNRSHDMRTLSSTSTLIVAARIRASPTAVATAKRPKAAKPTAASARVEGRAMPSGRSICAMNVDVAPAKTAAFSEIAAQPLRVGLGIRKGDVAVRPN